MVRSTVEDGIDGYAMYSNGSLEFGVPFGVPFRFVGLSLVCRCVRVVGSFVGSFVRSLRCSSVAAVLLQQGVS